MNTNETITQILEAAEEVAKNLPAEYKKYADRKIAAARNSGTLKAAYIAASDIVMMAEATISERKIILSDPIEYEAILGELDNILLDTFEYAMR